MNVDQAEVVAIRATEWLIGNDRLLAEFMALTGISVADIRNQIAEPEFLASILDFLLASDRRVVQFCDDASLSAELPMLARAAMPGGNLPHWT